MIKLIAADLDDTLLAPDATISTENKRAIQKSLQHGIMFTIATGRMFASAASYGLQLGLPLDQPIICYNGALIKRLSGEIIYEQPLSPSVASSFARYAQGQKWTLNAYYNDQLYVARVDERIAEYTRFVGVRAREVGDLAAFIEKGNLGLSKLLVIGDPRLIPGWGAQVKKLFGTKVQITQSRPKFIEVTSLKAHKGQALLWLSQFLNLKKDEVMAIGDSYNDLSMLAMAGLAIAMANGQEEVKKAAHHVTVSNSQHGVARAIEKHVLHLLDAV